MKRIFNVSGFWVLSAISTFLISASYADITPATNEIYVQNCASCHGENRLGGSGPALLPENLKRVKKESALASIKDGLPSTQMPDFKNSLSDSEIKLLVDFIYTPLDRLPVWDMNNINESKIIYHSSGPLKNIPVYDADPLNLFIVVESGDHHITILDGDRLEPIHRFKTRHALHGGPKYTPDGRFVFLASRDGWVSKFDLYNLKLVAEIRAGINTRNIAVSSDGKYVIVGNYLPHSLVILDASDLSPIEYINVQDDFGETSRVSAVYDAPPRKSFIVALKDLQEIWEVIYDENAEQVYPGLVHDFRYGEGIPLDTRFPIRRIHLDDYLDDFFFDNKYQNLIGSARNSRNGQVVNLIVGKKIADVELSGLPHLGSGITWEYNGKTILATPNLKNGEVSIIDVDTWKTIKKIKTLGPGFFMRTHENNPYGWVDVFYGDHKDVIHLIDKNSLEIVKTLTPSPGKTSAHVEFTKDGRYALISIWEQEGELIIYDANSLNVVKRLAMSKPSGKYNVYNKISGSSGTSH